MLETAQKEWNQYDTIFITKCENNGFILKLKSLAHDEEMQMQMITLHGNQVALVGVYGRSKKYSRHRLLGYILLYVGNPWIHTHTWYVGVAYSDKDDVRKKDPTPIAMDENIRFYKAGIDVYDYLLVYKGKKREHDEAGFSDGAAHLETAGQWKDGL